MSNLSDFSIVIFFGFILLFSNLKMEKELSNDSIFFFDFFFNKSKLL